MRHRKPLWIAVLIGMALSAWVTLYPLAEAQYSGTSADGPHVAVSNEINQHGHSLTLSRDHVTQLLESLGDTEEVTFQSSQEFNNAVIDNSLHSHSIVMDKIQLGVL